MQKHMLCVQETGGSSQLQEDVVEEVDCNSCKIPITHAFECLCSLQSSEVAAEQYASKQKISLLCLQCFT